MKHKFLVLLLPAIAACSTHPTESEITSQPSTSQTAAQQSSAATQAKASQEVASSGVQKDDSSKGVVCTYVIPTGSTLRRKRCTTPEERAAERDHAETMSDQRSRSLSNGAP